MVQARAKEVRRVNFPISGRLCNPSIIRTFNQTQLMTNELHKFDQLLRPCRSLFLLVMVVVELFSRDMYGQTASTGALTGVTLDPSGAALAQVNIRMASWMGRKQCLSPRMRMGYSGFSRQCAYHRRHKFHKCVWDQ